ncbi:MAG: creatininase family protein [Clostridia bacterium]|nr:creatininase family protein [Oscillospiraceae bacterium]MBQ2912034.1 creatininase family protein [Clostridia bacterium]MBQ6868632.1 creatininase family protein [Clostridia bacterium]MBQ7087671.1 creatininase family protein [Clostridia bacterium]MBQ7094049.1 creatininase family protein [Clostridia bacterium]
MRLEKMSWKQAENYFKVKDIAVIPVGSIENHGSHMCLGVDYLVPSHIAKTIDEKLDVLICPAVPYGVADGHYGFPGTISIGLEGLTNVMESICNALYNDGIRKFVFLNGHGGNDPALSEVGIRLNKKGAISCILNWWQLAGELNIEWKGGHGSGQETAAMLAIDPSCVNMDDYMAQEQHMLTPNMKYIALGSIEFKGCHVPVRNHTINMSKSGWYANGRPKDDPHYSSADWGKPMLDAVTEYICDFIKEFDTIKCER